jgi:hypothetical protein
MGAVRLRVLYRNKIVSNTVKGANVQPPAERGCFLRVSCSQRVKECETLENVEARLVTGAGFLRHALQYG